jgi:hypothetical protein
MPPELIERRPDQLRRRPVNFAMATGGRFLIAAVRRRPPERE